MSVLGEDGLGMELHAFDREFAVPHTHDLAVVGPRVPRGRQDRVPSIASEWYVLRDLAWPPAKTPPSG